MLAMSLTVTNRPVAAVVAVVVGDDRKRVIIADITSFMSREFNFFTCVWRGSC